MSGTHMQQLRRAGSHSSTDADAEDQSLRQRWRKDTAVPVEHPSCSLPSLSRRVDAPPGTITAECAAEANPVGFPAVQSNSSLRLLVSGDQRDASQQHALMEIRSNSNSNSNSGKSPDDASLPHVANSPSNTDVAPALPFSPLPHLDENGGSPRTHATNAPLDALPDAHSADPTATHPSSCATAATSVAVDEVAHNDTRTYPISSVKTPATTTELTSSCGDDFDDVSQHRQRTMEGDAGTATPSQVMMADGRHATSGPEIISAHPLAPPEDAHVPRTTSSQHDTPFTAVPRTAGGNVTTSSAHISPGGVPQQVIDSFASVDVTTPSVSNKYYSTLIPSGYHRFHQQHDEVLVRVESELDHSVPPSVLEERLPANISMDDDDDDADVPTQVHQGTAKENISTNAASDDDGEPTIATDIVADHDLSDEAPAALQLESSAVDEFARVNANGSNDSYNTANENNNSITRTYHRPATSDEVPSLPGSTKRVQPFIPAEATHNEANNNNNNTQDSDSRPSTSGMPNISSESAVSAAIREATTRNRQTLNTRISNNNSIRNNNNNNHAVRGPLRESDSFPPVSEYTPSISRNYNFSTLVPSAQPNRAPDDVVVGGSATHFPQDVLPQPNGGDDDERPIPMAPLFSEGAFHDSSTQQELSIPVEVTDLSNIRFSNSNTTSNTSPELRRTSSPSHPMPNIASVSAVSAMMHEDDEVEPPTTTNINIDVTRNNHNPHRVMGFIEAESESFPPMAESGASNSHNYYTHLRAPRTPQDYVEHDAEPPNDVEISQAVVPPENTADAPVPSPPSRDHFDQSKREVSEVMHHTSEDAHKVDAPSPPLEPHPTSSPPSPSSAAIRNASPRNNIDGIPRMGIADASESFPPTSANASTTSQPCNPSKRPSLVQRLALLEMRNTTTPDSAAINFTSVDVSSAKPTSPSSPAAVVVVPVDDDDATYNADPLIDGVGDDGEAAHGAAVDAVSDDENRPDAQYLCEEKVPEGEAQPMEEMHEHTDITDSVEYVDASMEQHEAPPSPSPQSSVQQDIVAEEDSVHAMSTPPPERPSTAEVPAPAHTPPVEDAAIKMDAAPPPSVATVPHPPAESAVEADEAPQDVPERRRRRRHHHRHRHSSRQEEEVHPEPQQPTTASEPPPPAPTPPTTPAPEVQPRRVELPVLETMNDDAEEAHSPVEEAEASASASSVSSSANAPDPLRATIRSPPPVADDDEPAALPPIKPQKKPAKPHDDDRPQPRRRQKKLAPLAKRGRKVQVPPEEEPTAHPPSPRNDSSPSGGRVRRNEEAGTPHRRKGSSPNRWKRRMNFSFDERLDDDPYRFNHPIDAPPRPEQKPPIPAPSAATCSWHVDKQKQLCIMEPMTFSVDDHPLPLHGRLLMRSSTKEEFSSSRPSSKRKARKDDGPSERSSHLPSKNTSFSDHPRASTSHSRRRDGAQKRHKHKKKHRLPRVRGTDRGGSHDLLGYYWPYIDPSTRQQLMKNTSLSQSEKESYVRSCTSDMFLLKELNAC